MMKLGLIQKEVLNEKYRPVVYFLTDKGRKLVESTVSTDILREHLGLISKPAPKTRAIIHSEDKNVLPLLKGQGNVNYLCGKCEAIIAERIWKLSLGNIVVECPSCQSYNEFPALLYQLEKSLWKEMITICRELSY